ncbi:GIY-YIG nuclease family protein, partial [Listeria valentina]|uniref:GIY-YIG nuclease family protein n=1 Tax=Listeria valentina TaxID=2705293 RepID=UPI001430AD55
MDSITNTPVIKRINYSMEAVQDLTTQLESDGSVEKELIIDYPTVYIIDNQQTKEKMVYVGETTDINRRTKEHLDRDIKRASDEKWSEMLDSKMYIIGHPYFNKSLTLDIENKLMSYMLGVK